MDIISRPELEAHADLTPAFVALIVDRFLQHHPPSFNASSRRDLQNYVAKRYISVDQAPPSEVLAALDIGRVLADRSENALARYIQRTGADFTRDEETCLSFLQGRPSSMQLGPDQASAALTFTTITQSPQQDPSVLVAALQRVVPKTFDWTEVVLSFDRPSARISSARFLRLYKALLPIAQDPRYKFDIQRLWGGSWSEQETQLSFVCAYASLTSDQLDATTIPGLHRSISIDDYAKSPANVRKRAAVAVKHPLVSVAALSAIFNVALSTVHASQSVEAKRLFQEVVVPNLDIFLVSAFEVPRQSWANMAVDTLNSLFENFLYKRSPEYDFVLDSLWKKDRDWVTQRLVDAHAVKSIDLPLIFDHAVKHGWLENLVYLPNGFGIDLAAFAHAEGHLDLGNWARFNADRSVEISRILLQFLMIKANLEIQFQRPPDGQPPVKTSTSLQVRTVSALLQILEDFLPKAPVQDLILVQRHCITAYPRLINYGEGYDDIIDANGKDGNALPPAANSKMEEHYKKMYGDEIQVRTIVETLDRYKHSRDALDQDAFACMIHGLFDEYNHYVDYPLEALATTAVLFGGIISHKLISDLPLKIGLGMILEAVRDHMPDDPMYKFGLQALMQLLVRFREWPGFCKQLLQIPSLQGTEAFKKAEEIVRDHEEEIVRSRNGAGTPHGLNFPVDSFPSGNLEEGANERQAPPFAAISIDPIPPGVRFEEPGDEEQGKIQFVLNNITEGTLQSMRNELRDMLERKHQQWFAGHLVEERAKMQPNYHHVYLELVKLFEDKTLWNEVLRETYISVARMLNSEVTMQNSTERTHLKNLGGWLGLLTLARDRPIKHKNIAFKQLLIEAHDTKRLIVVIPFVCKVLIQGASSAVFRPPNPWLMDIIHLLIELYHHAELKLNLKFEIEVLCKGLSLDHKSIEPSGEILNRPAAEEVADVLPHEQLDAFDSLSLNGIGSVVSTGLAPQAVAPTIPDVGPLINIPPTNEMVVSTTRLHEIVRSALTRALQDIIQPVVDRSITIAAISTVQMIRKDFVSEPDETRLRTAAINMVKATAGSLALVTSKEPLRANMTNYMRNLANDLPSGLPEGTIIMCVNSNLDLACSIIEKQAEERAAPEIEELLDEDIQLRRRHRAQQPNEPFYAGAVNRWAMTIPSPYKLSPNPNGLNVEQMQIYDDFARQPRNTAASTSTSHAPSTSDATRSLANEVLQEPYNAVPSIPTPAETPSVQHIGSQMPYAPVPGAGAGNIGRGANANAYHVDARGLAERFNKLVPELLRVAGEAREDHFAGLPRSHPVLDVVDVLVQHLIKACQSSEEFAVYAAEQLSGLIFQQVDDNLTLESLVHVLETLRKIAGPALRNRIRALFSQQPGSNFLSLPLLSAMIQTDLIDWKNIDVAMSKALEARKESSLDFLEHLLDLALLNNRPIALYADFVRTLETAWTWICDDPSNAAGQRVKDKLLGRGIPQPSWGIPSDDRAMFRQEQMEYAFEEWVQLCTNPNASGKATSVFMEQLEAKQLVKERDDFYLFVRVSLELSVDRFDAILHEGSISDAYVMVDALAKLICAYINSRGDGADSRASFLDSTLAVVKLVLHHHHMKRGEHLNQRVFFRIFSLLLHEIHGSIDDLSVEEERGVMLHFANNLHSIGPLYLPGFTFAWLSLLQHRAFAPVLLQMPDNAGWGAYVRLVSQLLDCLSEQLKSFAVSQVVKELYRATLKLLVVLQHDFPDFVAANYIALCTHIPPHCSQLLNAVLSANPQQPLTHAGLKAERPEGAKLHPGLMDDATVVLRECGLLAVLDQVLQSGPAEETVAQIAHTMTHSNPQETGYGHVPVAANAHIIGAVVVYIGQHAADRMSRLAGPASVSGSEADVSTLSLLVHELPPEARYYLMSCLVNQLRYPSAYTDFYCQLVLYMFGKDLNDPEETEIRQEITRVLLERLVGFWPQPWGFMYVVLELIKNDKYMFFDLPFVKSTPEVRQPAGEAQAGGSEANMARQVAERFAAILQRN